MATTALEINAETFVVECYQRRVEELTEVVASHSPRFRRIALRHLRNVDDAEDAVQDALLSALRHVDQFKGQAKMSTWVTTIVINSALMQLRRRLPQVPVPLDETDGEQNVSVSDVLPDTRLDPEHMYREREIVEILGHEIWRLSPTLRRTFQLRTIEGLSIRETAHLLGVPAGTVKARLARARMKLKQAVKKNFPEWGEWRCRHTDGEGLEGQRP